MFVPFQYVNMAILYYEFVDAEKEYLKFCISNADVLVGVCIGFYCGCGNYGSNGYGAELEGGE